MSTTFKWASGARIKISAKAAGKELDRIRREKGRLTPDGVVQSAKRKSSPLHQHFEWSNTKAAHQWRLQQASYLLRSITVIVSTSKKKPPKECRAYVNVVKDKERSYISTVTAFGNSEMREQILQAAWQELKDWRLRYARYSEFAAVIAAIDNSSKRKQAA